MRDRSRTPVIVGIGLSDYPVAPHLDSRGHHVLAFQRALEDSGVAKADIDGYLTSESGMPQMLNYELPEMVDYLGISPRWVDGSYSGGSTPELQLQHAEAAIRAGMAETVVITYGSDLLTRLGRSLGTMRTRRDHDSSQFESAYGVSTTTNYALAAQRHMHQYGTTSEQLASIAVGVREFASLNPNARYRTPITVEDVLASRMVADPLHLLDCCAITDGGGAVIVTTEERARDLRQQPVHILGTGFHQTQWNISQAPDITTTGAVAAGQQAFARAGLVPDDVDLVMFYDSFTITCLLLLEGLGFVAPGEGGPFALDGHLRRGGSLPMNTDGGGLSSCHPGMRGMFLIIEAVRQLRGQGGAAQVPGCEVAVAAGSGGWLSAIGVSILGTGL